MFRLQLSNNMVSSLSFKGINGDLNMFFVINGSIILLCNYFTADELVNQESNWEQVNNISKQTYRISEYIHTAE